MATRAEAINEENEAILRDEFRVDYVVKEIVLTAIDWTASKHLQAREEHLHGDTVSEYALAMRKGDEFPRPVVRQASKGKWEILSGNHTLAAVRSNNSTAKVWVLAVPKVESEVAITMVGRFNRDNGMRVSANHKMRQAAYLDTIGIQKDDIAEKLGITRSAVTTAIKARDTETRAIEHGVRGFDIIPLTVQAEVGRVEAGPVFAAIAETAVVLYDQPKNAKQVLGNRAKKLSELISQVKEAESDEQALELVGIFQAQVAEGRKMRRTRSNAKLNLVSACGKVMAVQADSVVRLTDDPEEAKSVIEWCERAAERLLEIEDAVRRRVRR